MIRNEKRGFMAIAAIAVLVLLAAVPLGSAAAATIFQDDFESGNTSKWSYNYNNYVTVTSGGGNPPPGGVLRTVPATRCIPKKRKH